MNRRQFTRQVILGSGVGLGATAALTGAAEADAAGAFSNELAPAAKLWSPDTKGLQVQIAVPNRTFRVTDTHLPMIVWFRNSSDKPVSYSTIGAPEFAPHGSITVTAEDGKNIIVGKCVKDHPGGAVDLAPGAQRGFLCDAFNQVCYRKPEGELKPGKYTVQFEKSNTITIEVVR